MMTSPNKRPGEVAASTEPDQIHPYPKDEEMNKATVSTTQPAAKVTFLIQSHGEAA